jgi:hypothetical protein
LLPSLYSHSRPEADLAKRDKRSLNDLIRALEQCLRQADTELPCSPEIDNQLELRRLLDRKAGGRDAFEDSVYENAARPYIATTLGP